MNICLFVVHKNIHTKINIYFILYINNDCTRLFSTQCDIYKAIKKNSPTITVSVTGQIHV